MSTNFLPSQVSFDPESYEFIWISRKKCHRFRFRKERKNLESELTCCDLKNLHSGICNYFCLNTAEI